MIVVSRRPPVTVVAKRDTSKEPVGVANVCKEREGMELLQEGEDKVGSQESER